MVAENLEKLLETDTAQAVLNIGKEDFKASEEL